MRNLKVKLSLVVVVGFLLMVNPASAAYESSQQVLGKAIANFNKSTTFSFAGNVTMRDTTKPVKYSKTYTSPARVTAIKSNLNGQFNAVNQQNKKYNLFFDLAIDSGSFSFKNLQVDLTSFGQKFYLRVNYPGDTSAIGTEINQFLNQWILIDKEAIIKDYLGTNYSNLIKTNVEKSEINLSELKSALESLRKNNVIILTKLKDEKVNGVDTFHYSYRVNKVGLRNFLITLAKQSKDIGALGPSDLKSLDTWLKSNILPTGSIWIGKKDYNIYRLTFAQKKNDKTKETNNIIDLTFNDFNQELYISAPGNFLTFEEVAAKFKSKDTVTMP